MPTILLTGATGFIGSHLLKELLKQRYQVIAVLRFGSNPRRIQDHLSAIRTCPADIASLRALFSTTPPDTVVHLATKYYKEHTTAEQAAEMLEGNIVYPATILDLAREFGVRNIVTAGTFFEYDLSTGKTLSENSPLGPYNFYAQTKIAFQDIARYYAEHYGLHAAHLRLFAPYGPNDNEKLLAFLSKNLIADTPFTMSPSEQQWNFTYVTDIVEAFTKAIQFIDTAPNPYEVFNIGATETHTVKEIVSLLETISGKPARVSFTRPYPPHEILYANCDGVKAKELLGWEARTSLQQGLQATWNFYSSQS